MDIVKINHYLWLLPFISFICGYQLLNLVFTTDTLHTPDLIGKSSYDALGILSDNNLNARILAQKEEADLPEGTVLSQKPTPHQKVRPHTAVFLLLSKKAPTASAPDFIGKSEQEIQKICAKYKIRIKSYYLHANATPGQCIGQIPEKDWSLPDNKMIVYISAQNQLPVLFPDLRLQTIARVRDFLHQYQIKPVVFHTQELPEYHDCNDCLVIDQKPLVGSIIDLNKPIRVHLQLKPKSI